MAKVQIEIHLSAMEPEAKEMLIAPGLTKLTNPSIGDLRPRKKSPLGTFIWNSLLALSLKNSSRQLIFNFVRKVDDSFSEYCEAADCLREYCADPDGKISSYFSALRNFEHCLSHLYISVRYLNAISKAFKGNVVQYQQGDGSILDRVNSLHNACKHMENRYTNPNELKFADQESFNLFATRGDGTKGFDPADYGHVSNVPIWLTNDGIESLNIKLSYAELEGELIEMQDEAITIAAYDPSAKRPKKKGPE